MVLAASVIVGILLESVSLGLLGALLEGSLRLLLLTLGQLLLPLVLKLFFLGLEDGSFGACLMVSLELSLGHLRVFLLVSLEFPFIFLLLLLLLLLLLQLLLLVLLALPFLVREGLGGFSSWLCLSLSRFLSGLRLGSCVGRVLELGLHLLDSLLLAAFLELGLEAGALGVGMLEHSLVSRGLASGLGLWQLHS